MVQRIISADTVTGELPPVVEQRLNDTIRSVGAPLFAGAPDLYLDPSSRADGPITSLTSSGFDATFGNSPMVISDGKVVFAPTVGGNAGGYIQGQADGPITGAGMLAYFPAAATGILTLVVPSGSWATPNGSGGWNPSIGQAGVHATLTPGGTAVQARYEGSLQNLKSYAYGDLKGTGLVLFEVEIDRDNDAISVYVNRQRVLHVVDPAAVALTSDYVIWELFANVGTGTVSPIVLGMWARSEARSVQRIPNDSPRGSRVPATDRSYAMSYNTTATYTVGTSLGSIDSTNLKLDVVFPSTGKLLVTVSCVARTTDSGTQSMLMALAGQGVSQRVLDGLMRERITAQFVLTGTAGGTGSIIPQASVLAGTGQIVVGGTDGPFLISAVPVN